MKRFKKKILSLLLSLIMIVTTMMPAMINVQASEVGKNIGAGVITSSIRVIPFIGPIASSAFGPLLNKAFKVTSLSQISDQLKEISAKLDELGKEIEKLEMQVEINHQEAMLQSYYNELTKFYNFMTDVQNDTEAAYSRTSSIINKSQSAKMDEKTTEMFMMLQIASIVKSTTFDFSKFVSQVSNAKSYIDGTGIHKSDSILIRIFKAYCNDAALGGEAAQMAGTIVNNISDLMQKAYVALNTILYACLYVNKNYNSYKELVKNDPNFSKYSNYLDAFVTEEDFSTPAKKVKQEAIDLWGEDIFDTNDKFEDDELVKLNENPVLDIGDEITKGVIGEYNTMVKESWFWYIDKVEYAGENATIHYEVLDKEMNFVIASDYGTTTRWDDRSNKTQTGSIESHTNFSAALRTAPNRGLTNEQTKRLLEHVKNSKYFGTEGTNKVTLEQALINYGFSFSNFENHLTNKNKVLPTSTRKTLITGAACDVHSDYDIITAYGPQLSDDVYSAYSNLNSGYKVESNYKKGKFDYLSLQLEGNQTDDFVAFYFTASQTIDDETEFIKFYESIVDGNNYRNKTIRLTKDLNLSPYNLLVIWDDARKDKRFCGVFDGNGHTISHIDMSNGTEWIGLFRSMGIDGEVKNLTITDSLFGNGKGMAVGGVVGQTTGDNTVIDNVNVINCIIKGTEYVGGIVGTSSLKKADYCDDMCSMINIRNCVSDSTIIGTDGTGGIEGGGGSVRIEQCTNKGTVTSIGAVGGIYGKGIDRDSDPQFIITDCINEGDIKSNVSYAGGVVGLMYSDAKNHYIYNNSNSGVITAPNAAGGIVGASYGGGTFSRNENSGNITSHASYAGGVVGWIQDDGGSVCYNVNSGEIQGNKTSGGVVGYAGDSDSDRAYYVEHNENTGNVNATNGYAGGIFGDIHSDNTGHTVKYNNNSGKITANSLTGGIVGYNVGGGVTSFNINEGIVESSGDSAGGIIGKIEDDATEIANNNNYNKVSGVNETGGIVGYIGSKSEDDSFYIHNNTNSGDIDSSGKDAGGIIGHLNTDANHTVNSNINLYANINGARSIGGIIGRNDGGGTFDSNKIYQTSVKSTGSDAGGIVGYIVDDKCEFVRSGIEENPFILKWLGISRFGSAMNDEKVDKDKVIEVKIEGRSHTGKIVGYDNYRAKTLNGDTLSGSIFGQGNVMVILVMFAIIAIAGAAVIIYKRKNTEMVAE